MPISYNVLLLIIYDYDLQSNKNERRSDAVADGLHKTYSN